MKLLMIGRGKEKNKRILIKLDTKRAFDTASFLDYILQADGENGLRVVCRVQTSPSLIKESGRTLSPLSFSTLSLTFLAGLWTELNLKDASKALILVRKNYASPISNLQMIPFFSQNMSTLLSKNINHKRSEIIGINLISTELNSIADSFGCRIGSWPNTYLGIPLLTRNLSCFGNRSLKRLKRSFSWSCSHISKDGRIILIQANIM